MLNRKALLFLSLMALFGATAIPAYADRFDVGIDVGTPPPPPQVEVTPTPRSGHVWAPGYWTWQGRQHVWVRGRWMGARPGFFWVPAHWVGRGPRYHFMPGHWRRG